MEAGVEIVCTLIVCVCVGGVRSAGWAETGEGWLFPFFFLRRHHNRPAGATELITWIVFVIHVL